MSPPQMPNLRGVVKIIAGFYSCAVIMQTVALAKREHSPVENDHLLMLSDRKSISFMTC